MDRSLEEMPSEYRYERKTQEPVLAVKWTGDNLEEVRKVYPGLGEEYMRDNGCGIGYYVICPQPGRVYFMYAAGFEELYQPVRLSVQGEELPPLDITPEERKMASESLPVEMTAHMSRATALVAKEESLCLTRQLRAALAEIRRLKGERDALQSWKEASESARIKCVWCGWLTERATPENDRWEDMRVHIVTCEKRIVGCYENVAKVIQGYQIKLEAIEISLSASRAEALKEAAAAICDYCKHRPETPPENRDGIWFHPETTERADGTTYDDSPTCRAQAILARMEKAL